MVSVEFHRQPDAYTCGASCLVAARVLTDARLAGTADTPAGWNALVLAAHRSLTRWRDEDGRRQVPWPWWLGTPPWTLTRAMTRTVGVDYRWTSLRLRRRRLREALTGACEQRPVVVYVGSRVLPRHVLLVTGADDVSTTFYNPSTGRLARFSHAHWPGPASRWRTVWGVIG